MGEGGAPFLFCGKLGRGCCRWGLSGPSLSLPWHFLPAICAGSWGRGRAPSPWWEGFGSRWVEEQPSLLGRLCPTPGSKDPFREPWAHHSHPLLGKNDKFRTPCSQKLCYWLESSPGGRDSSREGSEEAGLLCAGTWLGLLSVDLPSHGIGCVSIPLSQRERLVLEMTVKKIAPEFKYKACPVLSVVPAAASEDAGFLGPHPCIVRLIKENNAGA